VGNREEVADHEPEGFRRAAVRAPDVMTNTSEPFEHANEADVAEQSQDLDGAGSVDEPEVSPADANEADILEQGATVSTDDDSYPHQSEDGRD
jgi:hypothetical protein